MLLYMFNLNTFMLNLNKYTIEFMRNGIYTFTGAISNYSVVNVRTGLCSIENLTTSIDAGGCWERERCSWYS